MWQWNSQMRVCGQYPSDDWRREGNGGLIWVVGSEADDCVGLGLEHDRVALYGRAGIVGVCAGEETRVRICSFDDLESVAVKMPWVQVAVSVVDDNLDDVVILDDIGVDLAIDERVGRVVATHRQGTV